MSDLYELELETLEKRGVSRYKAVLMAAQEARYINTQQRMGNLDSKEKPTSIALKKLLEGRIVEDLEGQPA
ncbi:MAG: DNA-directed RNA polymerase subunit omega [Chitinispirillales bacterium]|jgi:DNA-directed RNA polymerase omega subunit|nr:DNA-directed RNA polymerase subunit omega [Chitinispirillales bacterium]